MTTKLRLWTGWARAGGWLLLCAMAGAQPPSLIHHQGRLATTAGTPLTTAQTVYFSIWKGGAATAAGSGADSRLYREHTTITPDASGVFEHMVGSGTVEFSSITTAMFDTAEPIFLQTAVGSVDNVLLPRARVTSVGYAFVAGQALYASDAGKIARNGEVNVAATGAVADCQFITDATISAGSRNLSSASNPFVAGDVGKSIVVANAGGSSANLVTTIAAFTDADHVILSDAASTSAGGKMAQWGTDNTAPINNAIATLTAGGTVRLGTGYYLVSSVNLTAVNSVNLVGAGWGINATDHGTVLVPKDGHYPVLDLTESGGVKIENVQIGTSRSPVMGRVGILAAQSAGNARSSLITLEHVFITGSWEASALYVYGVGDSSIWDSCFWNFNDDKYPMYFGRDNIDNVASRYQTIATGSVGCGNWHVSKFEAHNFTANGSSTGSAIRMRGAGAMNFEAGLIDSSSVNGNISAEQSTDGAACFRHVYTMCTFYTEGNTKPVHSINVPSGTYNSVTIINPSFTTSGPFVSGSINYVGFSTP